MRIVSSKTKCCYYFFVLTFSVTLFDCFISTYTYVDQIVKRLLSISQTDHGYYNETYLFYSLTGSDQNIEKTKNAETPTENLTVERGMFRDKVMLERLFQESLKNVKAINTSKVKRKLKFKVIAKSRRSQIKRRKAKYAQSLAMKSYKESKRYRLLELDTHNPLSPNYGFGHKDTYGMPLSNFRNTSFKREKETWERYFPSLMIGFKKYQEINPQKDRGMFTYTADVLIQKSSYNVGDVLVATLQSLDFQGRPKHHGGDYFRVRLIMDRPQYLDGIPCRVVDNRDGTYTISAPLVVVGKFSLNIALILPIEGIYEINNQQTALKSWSEMYYVAHFQYDKPTLCDVDLTASKYLRGIPTCDYSNPRNHEPWFCVKPVSNKCSPITWIEVRGNGNRTLLNYPKLCKTFPCKRVLDKRITITILPNHHEQKFVNLPQCGSLFEIFNSTFSVSGFFHDNRWISLLCKNVQGPIENLQQYLKNKVIYWIGDSTIRQFYQLIVKKYGMYDDGLDNRLIWHRQRVATPDFNDHYNITMYYRAHGPPLQNPGPPDTRPYISDSILGIPIGGDGVYVVFNIGAHLIHYDPSVFVHRLKGIKNAINTHREKFPETRFLLRGMNVVEYNFEFNIYRFEIILREMFKDMKNVLYLNFWDMTTVQPLNNFHPKESLLEEQCLYILSFMIP